VGGAAFEAIHVVSGDDPQEIIEQRELHRTLLPQLTISRRRTKQRRECSILTA
jgi:hypothetical protein